MLKLKEKRMNRIPLKKLLVLIVASLMLPFMPGEARGEKRIGVLLSDEDPRYVDCKNGVLEQLQEDGYVGPGVTFTIDSARSSKARFTELVRIFTLAKMDLIIPIGTPAAIAVTREIKDVPVVFGMVYDPVEAGIAADWKNSGNNTTGASPLIPMSTLVDRLKEFKPTKTLAVLYSADEKQSRIQLLELQKIQSSSQIKILPVILSERAEVAMTLSSVVRDADAIYLTGAGVIGASVPIITSMADRARVVTMTHLPDYVDKGVLLGVCANPYLVGRLAGKKAAQVLKGVKPSAIPIEREKKVDLILNLKAVKVGQFQISPSFLKKVTKTIE